MSILAAVLRLQHAEVREAHGYQIAKHLAEGTDRKLLTAYGTLYRALGRLEQMGLLESHWEDPQIAAAEARPGRRLYTLTRAGVATARGAAFPADSAPLLRGRKRIARA
jgi:PadR family transcriptional regulator, regulatory protein PadR